jgi:hypothetical protein
MKIEKGSGKRYLLVLLSCHKEADEKGSVVDSTGLKG